MLKAKRRLKKMAVQKVRHKQVAASFFFFFFALGSVPGMCPFSFVLRDQPINDSPCRLAIGHS